MEKSGSEETEEPEGEKKEETPKQPVPAKRSQPWYAI